MIDTAVCSLFVLFFHTVDNKNINNKNIKRTKQEYCDIFDTQP